MRYNNIPTEWVLLAEEDMSEAFEVDIARIYFGAGKYQLATATGCSCWDGDFEIESYDSLDEVEKQLGVYGKARTWVVSLREGVRLVAEARTAVERHLDEDRSVRLN